jgi:hypothetical protein
MNQTTTADLIGRLEDRIVDLERRLAQYEKPNKTASAASPYPDGGVTISTIKYPVVLPTADELRRLEEIAMRQYPKLRAGSDPASFKAAFFRLSYTCRAEKLDTKRCLDWWVDQCEDWLKAQGYYPTRPATQSFVAAAIAMGDIAFSHPSRFPSMSLAITALPQFEALPGRWHEVLASGRVPEPIGMPK